MGETTCQNCFRAFYRPSSERTRKSLRQRLKPGVPLRAEVVFLEQAINYCDDCLYALFPGMVAPRLHERADGECGGGRWVNPKRGDVRS